MRHHSLGSVIAGAAMLAAVHGAARADTIVLAGGGVIETERWWIEGDTLKYESPSGTVGLPRSVVVRIDPASGGAPPGAPAAGRRPAEPSGSDRSFSAERRAAEVLRLVREGAAALKARDFDVASDRFRDALREDPSIPGARVGFAVAEIQLGRDEYALRCVLDGLARDPKDADLHEILGDLKDRAEQVDDALREWREAFRVAPNDRLRDKIVKGEREQTAGADYGLSTTAHFNLRHDGDLDPALARQVADYLEDRFRDLSDAFRHAPLQPITVLLYPNRQFRDVTQAPDNVVGLYDGKIRVPLGGIKRLDPAAQRVLVHELTHAVVHSKTRGTCPRWLHEGLAQRMEGRTISRADHERVARLLRSTDPARWASSGSLSYPAALSLTLYLEELRGFTGLVDVLDRMGAGDAPEAALQQTYGEGYDELCRRWAGTVLGEREP
ncbi:MAG: tetratricopeptide repeat protein [Acidobacteriia bacterium]|nr:tetratricopeptide repeat protein [Terriglobia bacterium]